MDASQVSVSSTTAQETGCASSTIPASPDLTHAYNRPTGMSWRAWSILGGALPDGRTLESLEWDETHDTDFQYPRQIIEHAA